jgi:methylated-DNA-[protein]-cysteine S-methyltransferase
MPRSYRSQPSTPIIYIGRLPSSPIGPLWAAVSEIGLVAVDWEMSQEDFTHSIRRWFTGDVIYDDSRVATPLHQLSEFLNGRLKEFTYPLDITHLPQFQQRALRLTIEIPYGETTTYKDIAIQAGNPQSARAVGRAEATNPIPLVIPCHRVLGTDGGLHGYGGPGGVAMKAWLLNLEHTHK